MELDRTECILIAVFGAILLAVFGAILLCICIVCYVYCASDEEMKQRRQHKVVPVYDTEECALKQVEPNNVDLEKGETQAMLTVPDYTDGSIDCEYMTNEDEVAERADKKPGTLLWINEEQVFINTPGGKHAEILFITSKKQPLHISTMRIKNSPCQNCSTELINHFHHQHQKPAIFVGRIWHLDDPNHREGLRQLLINGLSIMDSHIDESNGEHKTELALREINDKYEPMQLHPHQTVKITEAVNNVTTYRDHSDRSIEEKYYNETKSAAVKECGTLLWTDEVCNKQQTINKQEDMCYTQPKSNRLNDLHVHVHTAHSEDYITHSLINEQKLHHSLQKTRHRRVLKSIDPKKEYTNEETVKLAHEMKGVTILLTNEGRVYWNTKRKHAEIGFIEDTQNPKEVTKLPIKNSPQCLIAYFKFCDIKPDIFIGKMYRQGIKEDDEGLQDLIKEGFNIEVWESFQQDPQNTYANPEKYLLQLRNEKKVIL